MMKAPQPAKKWKYRSDLEQGVNKRNDWLGFPH